MNKSNNGTVDDSKETSCLRIQKRVQLSDTGEYKEVVSNSRERVESDISGEYKIRPYKGFQSLRRGEPRVHPVISTYQGSSDKGKVWIIMLFILTLVFPVTLSPYEKYVNGIEFEHISIEQGISQGTVFCILQDSQGFMWFGTQNGLNRYDGNTFKVYTHDPRDPESLSHDFVVSIYDDQSGILWIGTWGGGLDRFDRKTGKFSTFKNIDSDSQSISNNSVWAIAADQNGNLWVGTEKGLNKFDGKEGKFTHYLEGERINALCPDSEGLLLVGTDSGLYYCEPGNKNFDFKEIKCKKKTGDSSPPQRIITIFEDKDSGLWVGTDRGIYKFNREKGQWIHDWNEAKSLRILNDSQINAIYKDKSGRLWIGTPKKGLFIYDLMKKELDSHEYKPGDPNALSHNEIKSIYEDKSGLVWIGTNGGGINKYDPNRKKFNLYRNIPKDPSSISHNDIMAIITGKDETIWVGTWGKGINRYNPEEKKFYPHEIPVTVSKNPNRNSIRSLGEDRSGIIWIGTDRAGLFTFKPKENKFESYRCKDIGEEENIVSICIDNRDQVWIGTMENGLVQISENRKEFKIYKHDDGNPNSVSDNSVFALFQDRDDILWIGTRGGGLNRLDIEKDQFTHYMPQMNDLTSLSHNFVTSIYQDKTGTLWIGTNGGGLNKFDRAKETFTAYTTRDGMPDNTVYAILEDTQGNLWISTNKGLARFNPASNTFRNYTTRDGLQGYESNTRSACKTRNGMMLFGGINGLNEFDPLTIGNKARLTPPPIVITAFKKLDKNNQIIVDTSVSEKKTLELSYTDDFISFEFSALSYSDPDQNQYAYKLEPVNKEWIPLGNKHDIDFLNLEPGDYRLWINGSNNDGVWNEKGTFIEIKVTPPFWVTGWFISLSILLSIGIIFFLFKKRVKNIEENRKKLKVNNLLLLREIEVRQQAEEKLRENEELYRNLIETSPDAITLCDIKGNIVMTNQQSCILLGYSDKEMLSEVKSIFRLLKRNERTKARQSAEKALYDGITRDIEFNLLTKDGTGIPVEVSSSLIKDSEGKPKYFLLMAIDIRQRKEAEQQEILRREKLLQVDKMVTLGTLVSGVAHELNNPAASIKMNSEIFARVWKDVVPVLEEYYKKNNKFSLAGIPYTDAKSRLEDLILGSMESAQRIEKIIKDLKDYSRPGDPSTREPIQIDKVIKSSVNLTHNLLKKSTKNFYLESTGNLPPIMGNFQKLEQVFINLIQNACHALPESTKSISISIWYEKEKKQVAIRVKDEGVGIEEKDLKHITDPFFTTKRDQGGTGLGLSICLQIIKDHDGTMEFDSHVGKGTTVTVTLPVSGV